jgi:hypothetical protein
MCSKSRGGVYLGLINSILSANSFLSARPFSLSLSSNKKIQHDEKEGDRSFNQKGNLLKIATQ